MSNLYYRIKKRYEMTETNWKRDCRFSKKLAWFRLIDDIGRRVGFKNISQWAHSQKDEWILKYLQNKFNKVIDRYKNDTFMGIKNRIAPIWICWWSGENDAPSLVKQCIKSIRKNAGKHPVYLITEQNYAEYVELADYIIEKVGLGSICIANFTDYLRVSLLEKYGGLWLDATMFSTNSIPEKYFELPIFTCKSNLEDNGYLSKQQWTSFCIGGWEKSVFFRFLREVFEKYWMDEEVAIDYLLVDYIIKIAIQNLPVVRQAMEKIPYNNVHRDDLQAAMNEALPANEFWNVIRKDTNLYKLSWRETYLTETDDKQETVYGYFLKMQI